MPVAERAVGFQSWVQKAGYRPVQIRQDWLITIAAGPFLWFLVHRDFESVGFRWSVLIFLGVPLLATIWAALRIRCSVCGIPVYALWLVGFPRAMKRGAFEKLPCCPYCLDDGTGKTGEPTRVDRQKEIKKAFVFGLSAVLLFIGLMVVVFGLGVAGWLPGYERPRPSN